MPVGQELKYVDKSSFVSSRAVALAAMALVTERGPIGETRLVTSWEEFQSIYGGHMAGRPGSYCARRALDAGCKLFISRVVHLSDPADASTKTSVAASVSAPDRAGAASSGRATGTATFPVALTGGDTLVVTINGGSPATATFLATAAIVTGSGATYAAVTASHKLVVVINGVRREVSFLGSEAAQVDFHDRINAGLPGLSAYNSGGQTRLATDRRGSSASLSVHADTDADVLASLGLSVGAGTNAGPNDVANIDAVTAAEFETVVEADVAGCSAGADASGHPYIQSNTTGTGSTVLVGSTSTADDDLGFDNTTHAGAASAAVNTLTFTASSDGTWAHGLRVVIAEDPADPTNRFRLRVVRASDSAVLETHDGLSMTSTDPRYVVNVLRDESLYFLATDLASAASAPANRPAEGTYTPASGNDGLTGLAYTDYVGAEASGTGLYAFATERGFRLVSLPDLFTFLSDANAFTAQGLAVAWAAARKVARVITNVPPTVTTAANALAWRRRTAPYATGSMLDSAYGALYAGWHELLDAVTRGVLWVPLDGEVLAAHARCVATGGVWFAPAGSERSVLSPEVRRLRLVLREGQVEPLTAAGINVAFRDAELGTYIEGAWTMQVQESALREVNVCMVLDLIGESIARNVRGLRYEPNDPELWRELRNRADKFLGGLQRKRGALTAYRVICDGTNNTGGEISARRTHLDVYVKPTTTSVEQKIALVVVGQEVKLEEISEAA